MERIRTLSARVTSLTIRPSYPQKRELQSFQNNHDHTQHQID